MPENATPQPNEDLVRVFETEQEAEAMVVRGLLESAGIDAEFGESENAEVLPWERLGCWSAKRTRKRHARCLKIIAAPRSKRMQKRPSSMKRPWNLLVKIRRLEK